MRVCTLYTHGVVACMVCMHTAMVLQHCLRPVHDIGLCQVP